VKYLLDTDTLIFWLKGDRNIDRKIQKNNSSNLHISVISLAELYYGAYKSAKVDANLKNIEKIKNRFQILKIDENVVEEFGRIKSDLHRKGIPVGDFDILIASIARISNFKLITNNIDHYSRIERLEIENWKEA